MKRKQIILVCFFLAAATLIAFWQVTHCEFTNYDDPRYVTQNSHIQQGITSEGIRWALLTGYASNWHPLTWISHMADVQFFGLDPRWHHTVNLLFHIATVLVLFLVFYRMTNALWQSAVVAALFAIHPLHVESVAWVAERKDVLSAFFGMLTIGAYVSYFRRPGIARGLVVVLCFVLGLMAKPMLVTLPFVLLLLDYWPLQRFMPPVIKEKERKSSKHAVKVQSNPFRWTLIFPLLLEKTPLFILAMLSSIITYFVQQRGGAAISFEMFPLTIRLGNALISYGMYIVKMLWPDRLAVLYPHPGAWPAWEIGAAVLFLSAVTFAVLRKAPRYPYLSVGWLWYLGTLIPVIGIVQVGAQAMADRYTYIPLIGLFIMAAWGMPDLVKKWHYRKEVLIVFSGFCLAGLFVVTQRQVSYWRTSLTLLDHTLAVTDQNGIIYSLRGDIYQGLGDYARAISDYDKAIEVDPNLSVFYNNRGAAYNGLGNYRQAIENFGKAIEINPKYLEAYINRGNNNVRLGAFSQAIEDFNRAIEINANSSEAYINRGNAYNGLGNQRQAIQDYARALEIDPRYVQAYVNRGNAFNSLGDRKHAVADYDRAIQIDPGCSDAYYNRGIAHYGLGDYLQAIADFAGALQINPKDAAAHNNRGIAYNALGNYAQALSDFAGAIEINPKFAEAYSNRAAVYYKLNDPAKAIEDLKAAASLGHEGAMSFLRNQGIAWTKRFQVP